MTKNTQHKEFPIDNNIQYRQVEWLSLSKLADFMGEFARDDRESPIWDFFFWLDGKSTGLKKHTQHNSVEEVAKEIAALVKQFVMKKLTAKGVDTGIKDTLKSYGEHCKQQGAQEEREKVKFNEDWAVHDATSRLQ